MTDRHRPNATIQHRFSQHPHPVVFYIGLEDKSIACASQHPPVGSFEQLLHHHRRQAERQFVDQEHLGIGQQRHGEGELLIVTQNIDDLHERAGARRVLHMHGEALSAWCTACDERQRWTESLLDWPPCPSCGTAALRPDIVWFGEMPYQMDRIFAALAAADLFVSVGTSGAVYPAAGFVQQTNSADARTLELNLERSQGSAWFDETRLGPASELVPRWVEEVLA